MLPVLLRSHQLALLQLSGSIVMEILRLHLMKIIFVKIWPFLLTCQIPYSMPRYGKDRPEYGLHWSTGNYKVSDDTDWIFYASTFDNSTKLVNIYIN